MFMEASAKTGFNAKNVFYYYKNQIFIEAAKTLYTEYINYKDKVDDYVIY